MMNIIIEKTHLDLSKENTTDDTLKGNRISESTFIIDYDTPSTNSFMSDRESDDSSSDMSCDLITESTCETEAKQTPSSSPSKCLPQEDDLTESTLVTLTDFSCETSYPKKGEKRVRFGSLEIHEHGIQLGGSGIPHAGPSISIEWGALSHFTIDSVETYEDARPCLPRRGAEMMRPKAQRIDTLLGLGYSMTQIRNCSQECEEVRSQRAKTVSRLSIRDQTLSALKKLMVWKTRRHVLND